MAAEGPALIVVGGFAGAGKSTVSARLATELGAPLLSSSVDWPLLTGVDGVSTPISDQSTPGWCGRAGPEPVTSDSRYTVRRGAAFTLIPYPRLTGHLATSTRR